MDSQSIHSDSDESTLAYNGGDNHPPLPGHHVTFVSSATNTSSSSAPAYTQPTHCRFATTCRDTSNASCIPWKLWSSTTRYKADGLSIECPLVLLPYVLLISTRSKLANSPNDLITGIEYPLALPFFFPMGHWY